MDDNWERIQQVFLEAVELPLAKRPGFLNETCGDDAGLRLEIESLLRAEDAGGHAVEAAIASEAGSMFDATSLVGSRLGAYLVIEEIGRGGMGSVYLAERDDDQFRKQVAIKVVKRGMDTAEVLSRFRHERQILAGLEHPYIARLLDGGTTPDGRPYLVMERVEGQPIDVYCRERQLGLEARLLLFVRVCEAVSYAHRALVVHRDLKPSNILIDSSGTPKLLDFGVAKLLDSSTETGLTISGYGPLTPEYASPEQVRGLPITTATDVYALGTILFEILTGSRAQNIETHTPAELDRVICETQPVRPSLAIRSSGLEYKLDGDLDNIVLMAMRKESERRYQSVDQFSADIIRHLKGLPVVARQDSFTYRSGKFISRHRLSIGAASLVAASLVGGIAVAVTQAKRAEAALAVAETERTAAVRERARAEAKTELERTERDRSERRLSQMIELADRSLYDVHSAIEKLPGSMDARKQIVTTTLQFLENLSKDAGQDDRLHFVLAAAYSKVGDVQGYPLRPNLGDSKGAVENYKKSAELLSPLLAKEPDNPQYLREWIEALRKSAFVLVKRGETASPIETHKLILPASQRLAKLCPQDPECSREEPAIHSDMASLLAPRDTVAALGQARSQVAGLERVTRQFPKDTATQLDLASAHSQKAGLHNLQGELREAAAEYQQAIVLREKVVGVNPTDVMVRRSLMITYGNLGGNLGSPFYQNLGDTAGAVESYGKALAIGRALASADPGNQLARLDLAHVLLFSATLDLPRERFEESLDMLGEAASILQDLLKADSQSAEKVRVLSMVREYEGRRLDGLGRFDEAILRFRQSLQLTEGLLARDVALMADTSQALAAEEGLAAALAHQRKYGEAREMAQRAVERALRLSPPAPLRDRVTRYIAMAWLQLGSVNAAAGHWAEAHGAAQKSVDAWQSLRTAGSHVFNRRESEQAEALLEASSVQLSKK